MPDRPKVAATSLAACGGDRAKGVGVLLRGRAEKVATDLAGRAAHTREASGALHEVSQSLWVLSLRDIEKPGATDTVHCFPLIGSHNISYVN